MKIIPAIDIKNGNCVRLLQGRMDKETVYSDDPVETARKWQEQGADTIHVVDLDGAIEKQPKNLMSIQRILSAVDGDVQVGGGIRNDDTVSRYIDMGVKRIVIGTKAVENTRWVSDLCKRYPGKIIVGIDARNGMVSTEGWTKNTRIKAADLAARFEDSGVAAINFTDIHRDGMQTGPNIDETRKLAAAVSIPVVASGGVSTLEDIKNLLPLAEFGVVGVITGKALYSGTLNLKEAIQLAGFHS
ncbi:MAG: 1-(5-phosphoribosyl)-5-[(5-phosphoribosylamino)methylideneamino]imidazole-4-carboxamide isomerase [Desulfobacterales bacterium]